MFKLWKQWRTFPENLKWHSCCFIFIYNANVTWRGNKMVFKIEDPKLLLMLLSWLFFLDIFYGESYNANVKIQFNGYPRVWVFKADYADRKQTFTIDVKTNKVYWVSASVQQRVSFVKILFILKGFRTYQQVAFFWSLKE